MHFFTASKAKVCYDIPYFNVLLCLFEVGRKPTRPKNCYFAIAAALITLIVLVKIPYIKLNVNIFSNLKLVSYFKEIEEFTYDLT